MSIVKSINEAEVLCYRNFYYLYRQVGKNNYLGRYDYRLGWYVKKLSIESIKEKTKKVKPKAWQYQGHEFSPFTEKEVKDFHKLNEVELGQLVKNSKEKLI
jgi:hypothetical protein